MEGPLDRIAKLHPPNKGFVQRLCNYSDARLEELIIQGYRPVLKVEPVVVDVGGGQFDGD